MSQYLTKWKDKWSLYGTHEKMERLFSASALYTVHLSCHRLWSDKKWIFRIFQPSQGVGKILTNIWQTNFYSRRDHLYRVSGKCTHHMHFLIFAPNPNSNAALWNARAWPANARTSPANFGFRSKFSFRCRTVQRQENATRCRSKQEIIHENVATHKLTCFPWKQHTKQCTQAANIFLWNKVYDTTELEISRYRNREFFKKVWNTNSSTALVF